MTTPTLWVALAASAIALVPSQVSIPANAHEERGLDAGIVGTTRVFCDFAPICRAEGRVRIANKRPVGSGSVAICVGIQAHTASHRNLSVERLSPSGQAVASVRPGRSKTTTFKTVYDESAGSIDHVHVVHTHRHIVQGGRQC